MRHFKRALRKCKKHISFYSSLVEKRTSIERSEAEQSILFRMWIASKKYNPKLSKLKTYFINVIKQQVIRLTREDSSLKNKKIRDMMSLYDSIGRDERTLIDIIPQSSFDFEKDVENEDIMSRVYEELEGQAKKVFFLIWKYKMNVDLIASKMDMTRMGIYKIIKEKIRPVVYKFEKGVYN